MKKARKGEVATGFGQEYGAELAPGLIEEHIQPVLDVSRYQPGRPADARARVQQLLQTGGADTLLYTCPTNRSAHVTLITLSFRIVAALTDARFYFEHRNPGGVGILRGLFEVELPTLAPGDDRTYIVPMNIMVGPGETMYFRHEIAAAAGDARASYVAHITEYEVGVNKT